MHLIIKGGVQSKSHCKYQFIIMCSTFGSYFSVFHATCIGLHSAFEKYGKDKLDSRGQPYDYGSIMHYPWNAFSTNGRNTLVPKRKVYQQPYRVLSKSDAIQAKLVYNCAGNGKLVDAVSFTLNFLAILGGVVSSQELQGVSSYCVTDFRSHRQCAFLHAVTWYRSDGGTKRMMFLKEVSSHQCFSTYVHDYIHIFLSCTSCGNHCLIFHIEYELEILHDRGEA